MPHVQSSDPAFEEGHSFSPDRTHPRQRSEPARANAEPVSFASFGPRGGIAWTLARRLDGVARLALAGSFDSACDGLPLACVAGCRFVLIDFGPFAERRSFDPWAAIESLQANCPQACLIAVDLHAQRESVLRAIELGARGYISPIGVDIQRLAAQLAEGAAQGACLCPLASRHLVDRVRAMEGVESAADHTADAAPTPVEPPAALSAREMEILALGEQGLAVKSLARQLQLSPHTVTTHLKNVYRKLDVKNRSEAIYRAKELGLI